MGIKVLLINCTLKGGTIPSSTHRLLKQVVHSLHLAKLLKASPYPAKFTRK